MLDKLLIKAPAKINLFLRIISQREDGYHNIRSGITFINLFDEVSISISNSTSIQYFGPFAPLTNTFENDIVIKTLDILNLSKNIKLNIRIKKNIPTKAGLGSASTNAAALVKGLHKMNLIEKNDYKLLSKIGADVPVCFYADNCLVTGIGDQIYSKIKFPKYYFVLVKPNIGFSTARMYKKIKTLSIINSQDNKDIKNSTVINDNDFVNDFERIIRMEDNEINKILNYLSNIDQCLFARMTGTGSCCYAVFNKAEHAINAFNIIKIKFINFWSCLGENNLL